MFHGIGVGPHPFFSHCNADSGERRNGRRIVRFNKALEFLLRDIGDAHRLFDLVP